MKFMKINNPLIAFDLGIIGNNEAIIGVDEAGRGPLAGPVFASAVRLDTDFYKKIDDFLWLNDVDDSKKIAPKKRERLFASLIEAQNAGSLSLAICSASVEEIEQLNILGATMAAMYRALEKLNRDRSIILVDGNPLKTLGFNHSGIVKGDGKSLAIALASIAAKVLRDKYMENLDQYYPNYGFIKHKGYGTRQHIAAIKNLGLTPEHRSLFVRKIL
ncbi:MAG: ribonuclease HII [Puniceicoccales bacterium]|jgi:ribonuclease HII|nr:ribonuclease HII [Puniceicoccales bacterium]